jgi:hypothetical protein
MWRWPQALKPSEQEIRLIVSADNLKMWLDGELDDESLPFGPLTSLLRCRTPCARDGSLHSRTNHGWLLLLIATNLHVALRSRSSRIG